MWRMQKCLLRDSKKVDCWPDFSDKMWKIWMTMVAQKFKILSKRTACESVLTTHSDSKQGFAAPRGKRRCTENGLCSIRKFCTCLLFLCLLLIQFFQFDVIFLWNSFWEIELTKQMTDQEDNIILGKIVFDDRNQEKNSWACLGQACSRSLIVFLSQLLVILLIILGCFWRSHLSKTCDKSTVWVGNLCSAARYNLPSPRLWTG